MNRHRFFIERAPTPTGVMLLLTDEKERLRALDWEDHEARMRRLLRLHYGDGVDLAPRPGASKARLALEAYFGGALGAIDALEVETGGTAFQREVWAALRAIKMWMAMVFHTAPCPAQSTPRRRILRAAADTMRRRSILSVRKITRTTLTG